MMRLAMVLFSLVATSTTGMAIVVALTTGQDGLRPILIAAGLGLAAAIPVTWIIARRMF